MKFNQKYLALAIFVVRTVSCDGREDLIKKLNDAEAAIIKPSKSVQEHREKMIHALSNPQCLIKQNYDLMKVESSCKDENPHEFYRLSVNDEKQLATLSEHCHARKNLEGFSDDKLKDEIEKQYEVKKKFLEAVIHSIPGFAYYLGGVTDEFDKIIQSHIKSFIASSLVYDGKRLTFSALHKSVEGILNAYEVDRKAIDGIKGARSLLDKKDVKLELIDDIPEGFVIKPSNPEKIEKDEKAKKDNKKKIKPINIIESSLKAADKSTSSSRTLNNVLVLSLSLSFGLLLFKSITAKPPKDDEEEEEMEEKH